MAGSRQYEARRQSDGLGGSLIADSDAVKVDRSAIREERGGHRRWIAEEVAVTIDGSRRSGPASLDAQLKQSSKSPRPIRSGKVA